MDTTETRRFNLKKNYYFLCECARCLGMETLIFSSQLCFQFICRLFRSWLDEREPIEMCAAACPNSGCIEMIHFKENTKLPFNCSKCDHLITEKHYQMFRDVTNATGMHLDKMKMSNIACNWINQTLWWIVLHFNPLKLLPVQFRLGRLQRIDSKADRCVASIECLSFENAWFGIWECHRHWQMGRSTTLWKRSHSRVPVSFSRKFIPLEKFIVTIMRNRFSQEI